jgi:hypothetical protein
MIASYHAEFCARIALFEVIKVRDGIKAQASYFSKYEKWET